MKFALLSHTLPPSTTGQAVIIHRLLQELDPSDYCLVSTADCQADNSAYTERLPGAYYHLPPPLRINRGHRFALRYARDSMNITIAVVQHARAVAKIVRKEKAEAIVACTGDVTIMPAAYLAGRRLRVPFYAYIFDDYSYREWNDPSAAFWARRFEPFLMKHAAAVIVPNEVLRDDLRARFGVEAVVIHNSLNISPYRSNGEAQSATSDREIKIVYAGEIYEAHYDAFRCLITAIESLGRPELKLHVYTHQRAADLEPHGICGPVVFSPLQPTTKMPQIQMQADLLFLPLAFSSPYPHLIRTSSTTKLGEYLAARRPLLVHAPNDSFVSWYCRQHECGFVVDQSDPALLAEALQRVLGDRNLRQTLTANAWRCAQRDFDISEARTRFLKIIGSELP